MCLPRGPITHTERSESVANPRRSGPARRTAESSYGHNQLRPRERHHLSGSLGRKHLARRGHLKHVSLGDRRPGAFRPDLPGNPFVREIVDLAALPPGPAQGGRRCLLVAAQDGAGEAINGDRLEKPSFRSSSTRVTTRCSMTPRGRPGGPTRSTSPCGRLLDRRALPPTGA